MTMVYWLGSFAKEPGYDDAGVKQYWGVLFFLWCGYCAAGTDGRASFTYLRGWNDTQKLMTFLIAECVCIKLCP